LCGSSYSQTPGFIDNLLNRPNAYNLTNSLILTSNISPNLDFTLSYTSNYSIVRIQPAWRPIRHPLLYQSASGKLNLILPLDLFQYGLPLSTEQGIVRRLRPELFRLECQCGARNSSKARQQRSSWHLRYPEPEQQHQQDGYCVIHQRYPDQHIPEVLPGIVHL